MHVTTAQTLIRHHLFCHHPHVTALNKSTTSLSPSVVALSDMQSSMLHGLAANHFKLYKHDILSALSSVQNEIPARCKVIIESLASITASAEAVEMTHLTTGGTSVGTAIGKMSSPLALS